jgi:LytS/YehU family sensor histidine kinase
LEITDLFSGGIKQLWKNPLILLINVSVWALLLAIITLLLSSLLSIGIALLFASFNVTSLMVLYYLNIYLVDRFIEAKQYLRYSLYLILLLLSVVFLRIQFNLYYLTKVVTTVLPIEGKWLLLFSIVITIIVLAISFFNGLLMNRSRKEKEYLRIIAHQQEIQVAFLKTQMSPHFLFNTLNNVYSLTLNKAPQASEMILLLSEVLRYAVYRSKEIRVELSTEVEQINKILQLHGLRSESKSPVTFNVQLSSDITFIEPMILIPLVENCFKHSNIETSDRAYISMSLKEGNGIILFESSNSKDKVIKNNVEGIGLKNIKERLMIRYPDGHKLEVRDSDTSFSVYLQIKVSNE